MLMRHKTNCQSTLSRRAKALSANAPDSAQANPLLPRLSNIFLPQWLTNLLRILDNLLVAELYLQFLAINRSVDFQQLLLLDDLVLAIILKHQQPDLLPKFQVSP